MISSASYFHFNKIEKSRTFQFDSHINNILLDNITQRLCHLDRGPPFTFERSKISTTRWFLLGQICFHECFLEISSQLPSKHFISAEYAHNRLPAIR